MDGAFLYNNGTISVTNGSANFTGTGTDWLNAAPYGAVVTAPDGKDYEATFSAAGVGVFAEPYAGPTATDQPYWMLKISSLSSASQKLAEVAASYRGVAFLTQGDQYWKLNKSATANNVGEWYQTNGEDRFRIGLWGDDDFRFQRYDTGTTSWVDVLKATLAGVVTFSSLSITGVLSIPDTTQANDAATGSGVFSGGLGVAKNIYAGGVLGFGTGAGTLPGTLRYDDNWGAILTAKTAAPAFGHLVIADPTGTQLAHFDAAGNLIVDKTTVSTSPTSGALQVSGGMGVAGDVNLGGKLTLKVGGAASAALNLPYAATFPTAPVEGDIVFDSGAGPKLRFNNEWRGISLLNAADGKVPDAQMPATFSANAKSISDLNNATETGFYYAHALDAANVPSYLAGTDNWWQIEVQRVAGNPQFAIQIARHQDGFHEYRRTQGGGVWTAWKSSWNTDPSTGLIVSNMIPAPVTSDMWRVDGNRAGLPRTYIVSSVSGTSLVISTARAFEINGNANVGVAMVRLWNITKAQSTWVTATDGVSTLTVRDASEIASWAAGDTLQLGEPNPTGTNVLGMIAVDLSPYMIANFGSAFKQKGILFSAIASGIGGDVNMGLSGSGASGSAADVSSLSNGTVNNGFMTVFTPVASPISNSNLFYVRERLGSGTSLSICLLRIFGLYV